MIKLSKQLALGLLLPIRRPKPAPKQTPDSDQSGFDSWPGWMKVLLLPFVILYNLLILVICLALVVGIVWLIVSILVS